MMNGSLLTFPEEELTVPDVCGDGPRSWTVGQSRITGGFLEVQALSLLLG